MNGLDKTKEVLAVILIIIIGFWLMIATLESINAPGFRSEQKKQLNKDSENKGLYQYEAIKADTIK